MSERSERAFRKTSILVKKCEMAATDIMATFTANPPKFGSLVSLVLH